MPRLPTWGERSTFYYTGNIATGTRITNGSGFKVSARECLFTMASLYNKKGRASEELAELDNLAEVVAKCKSYIDRGSFDVLGKPEVLTRQYLVEPFLRKLGWSDDPLYDFHYVREFSGGMDRKWEDYVLLNKDRPLIFVETKHVFEKGILSNKNINELLNYMKEYNRKNRRGYRIDWGILTNFKELHVFYVSDKEPFLSLTYEEYVNQSNVLVELLSVDGIKRDGIDHFYSESSKEALGDQFLNDLKKWRLILANGFFKADPNLVLNQIKEASQLVLDRLIFIRMLETLGILPYNWLRGTFLHWQEGVIGLNQTFSEVIRDYFASIESLYDTELFLPKLYDQLGIDDKYLMDLIKIQGPADPEIYKKIGIAGQLTLDDKGIYGYNFKTLTIDIIGSTYERYLAHEITLEKDRVVIKETKLLRKKEGVYYTPPYVVDHIVETTVKPLVEAVYEEAKKLLEKRKFKEASQKIREISSIKVLDPACGSGSFLIKVFHTIAECYMRYNQLIDHYYRKMMHEGGLGAAIAINTGDLKIQAVGERVLLDNIYGVDLDPQAVEITKLNLWLKMLSVNPVSYQPTIGKKQKKLLPSLATKIKCGNSLFSGINSVEDIKETEDLKNLRKIIELREKIHSKVLLMTPVHSQKMTDKELQTLKSDFDTYSGQKRVLTEKLLTSSNKSLQRFFVYKNGGYEGLNGPPFNWEIEFPEVFFNGEGLSDNPGFDVILGNPPHGAELAKEERNSIEDVYSLGKGYKNTAFLFLERACTKLKDGGILGLVIPKSLTFAQKWSKVRKFILKNLALHEISDISKAFKGVLLEQIVIIAQKNQKQTEAFKGFFLDKNVQSEPNTVPIWLCQEIDAFPIYADEESISIYKKIKMQKTLPLGKITRTFRGFPYQSKLRKGKKQSSDQPALRGDDIRRFSYRYPSEYLSSDLVEGKEKVNDMKQPKIVSQRIVAHVTRPVDHIIIMATLDKSGLLDVDTVENTILTDDNYNLEYILSLLNSRLIGWYTYIFIFNKAIRTMDLDDYYVGKIPIIPLSQNSQLSNLVNAMLVLCEQKHWIIETFNNLVRNYGFSIEEKLNYYFDPYRAKKFGINIAESTRISSAVKGIISGYKVRLDDNRVIISVSFENGKKPMDAISLKFEDELVRDYFFVALKQCEDKKGHRSEKEIFETTMEEITIPRYSKSSLPEENVAMMRDLMETLVEEHNRKTVVEFSNSPVQVPDLADVERRIYEIDALINSNIYDLYGLSKAQIRYLENRFPSLTRLT